MSDTFPHDLRQEPELLWDQHWLTPEGHRHWPNLAFAWPMGFRPLMMDLTLPQGPGPHPLVIYIHGGAWLIGTPKYGNPTLRGVGMMSRLLDAGHAVARISYRLAGEAPWPAPHQDCQAALGFVTQHAARFGLDPARIAVIGESAGGHLAAMLALDPGPGGRIAAAVNWYGAVDLPAMQARPSAEPGPRPEEHLVGPGPDMTARLAAASPVTHVHAKAPPFLHQHGDADRVVPLSQAETLHHALLAAGARSDLHVIPGADHCFWNAVSPAIMDRVLAFLDQNLGPHMGPNMGKTA